MTYTPAKGNKKVSNKHYPLSPALALPDTHRVEINPETPPQKAETQEDKDMGEYEDEDMESGVIVSHEHAPSAPVLAPKIPHTEIPLKEVCKGLSTVPPADAKPGRVGKPVGVPTQDHSRTGVANEGLAAGKDQHGDQIGCDEEKGDDTSANPAKISTNTKTQLQY